MSTIINYRQAKELLAFFGGHDTEVTLLELQEGEITGDDGEPMPAGLYAHLSEYPEEGSHYLGPNELDDELAENGEVVPIGDNTDADLLRAADYIATNLRKKLAAERPTPLNHEANAAVAASFAAATGADTMPTIEDDDLPF
jgi:hypothetical protein